MYELTIGFFKKLVSMCDNVWNFLFTEIDLTLLGLGKVSLWVLIGGAGLIALLIAWLIKKVVPVA